MIKKIIGILIVLTLVAAALLLFLPIPGDVPILMYHFAGTEEEASQSSNMITIDSFKTQMEYLRFFHYRVISMEEYEQILFKKKKPLGREIVLTFDDGNYSYQSHFLPVLEKYQYPSTVFLVSESIKQQTNGSMTEATIREIIKSPLVTLASHTKTHPFLTKVSDEQLRDEIEMSKKDLEAMFGRPMHYFSYPFGELNAKAMRATQAAGYHIAFSTSVKKLKQLEEGPFSRTRVKMDEDGKNVFIFLAKTSGLYKNIKGFFHLIKQKK